MTTRITAPVPGLNGSGVGGLQFVDSVAETDNEAIVAYCRDAGYTVEDLDAEPTPSSGEGAPGIVVPEGDLDARLDWIAAAESADDRSQRASAVYSHERDTDDGTDLEALGARLRVAVYGEPKPEVNPPAGNASRDDWAVYVTALGQDPGELTRDELRDAYGPKA